MEDKRQNIPFRESSIFYKEKNNSKERIIESINLNIRLFDKSETLTVKEKDYDLYIKLFRDVPFVTTLNSTIISKTKSKIILPNFNRSFQFKLFIFLLKNIFFQIKNQIKSNNIVRIKERYEKLEIIKTIIIKLYRDNYFLIEDIVAFIKFQLIWGFNSKLSSKPFELSRGVFFTAAVDFIKEIFIHIRNNEEHYTKEEQSSLIDIFDFINNCFLINSKENVYCLLNNDYYTTKFFEFTSIIRHCDRENIRTVSEKLLSLIMSIYGNSLSYRNVITPFVNDIKNALVNKECKTLNEIEGDISIINFHFKYIVENCRRAEKTLKEDPFQIERGFYLSNSKSGFHFDYSYKKTLCFIISFKLIPKTKNETFTIVSIVTKKSNSFTISINKNKNSNHYINCYINSKVVNTEIFIQPYKTYLFIIQLANKNKDIILHEINRNSRKEIRLPNSIDIIDAEWAIGCNVINKNNNKIYESDFTGDIGTFILIEQQIDNNLINTLLKLKGRYDEFLTLPNANDKVTLFNDKIAIIISPRAFKFHMIKEEKFKIYNEDYIPKCSYENIKHYSLAKSNFLNVITFQNPKQTTNKIQIECPFDKSFHTFEIKTPMVEFIKNEGLNLLILQCEYYYQMACHLSSLDSDEKEINSIISQMYNININI